MNLMYIFPIIVITALLTATIMNVIPLLKWWVPFYIKRFKTSFKPKPKEKTTLRDNLEPIVMDIIKDKINSGLVSYHKKQMIKEIVQQEVINYLNQLKK
jgi:hypothetical protein